MIYRSFLGLVTISLFTIAGAEAQDQFRGGAGGAGQNRATNQPQAFQSMGNAGNSNSFNNSGFGNTGFGNTGFGNTGFGNTGFGNTGFGSSNNSGFGTSNNSFGSNSGGRSSNNSNSFGSNSSQSGQSTNLGQSLLNSAQQSLFDQAGQFGQPQTGSGGQQGQFGQSPFGSSRSGTRSPFQSSFQSQFGGRGGFGSQFNSLQNFGQQGIGNRTPFQPALRLGFVPPAPPVNELSGRLESRVQAIAPRPAQAAIANPSLTGIQVAVADQGVVTLRGSVSSESARRLAENMIRLEPGVRRVVNELEVSSDNAATE